jgi:hypothetical protein
MYIYERYKPSRLLLDLTSSVEAVNVERELPPRVASCIAGYAWLRGINITIDWLRKGVQDEPKGIAKLYPRREDELLIPKLFTAPTMYILGHLANGHNEFSEDELRTWLSFREMQRNDVNFIVNLLARAVTASNHRLVNPFYDGYTYRFKFNPSYTRMRERYRERSRT